ncbi:MAG: DNA helicase II [Gammaproteobacteria bacterium]|nr:DNA helicase II [Gammaproteobacteria bacterium]MDH3535817.1 DNA helicase II [Gammaproteobacteria bacterium]
MDVSHLIDPLNEPQREAVSAEPGPILVLAGAGSGKTRVLTHRVAWVCEVNGLSPYSVLAVTFTNKAASEMRSRVESLLGISAAAMWVGTFHGLAHRMLRLHYEAAGLPQGFQILDSDDQLRMVKRVIRQLDLDEARWPPKQAQWFINHNKDEGLRPAHIDPGQDPIQQQMLEIYRIYQDQCERAGVVDFAELLLRVLELIRDHDDIREHYHRRFRHILVDEFQDTNAIQYAWLRLMAGAETPVFVVGDDDQSIYGWRGARIENIHHFEKDFAATRVIRLEQNYRSTGTILKAANALIDNNHSRLGKELWTQSDAGEPILFYSAYNEKDEARFVVDRIESWVEQGRSRKEVAVLYRSNAQSRQFEETLVTRGVPYRVYGGLRFFERAEIKDTLAYLRMISSPAADNAFERTVNHPPRGIGQKTIDEIRNYAREQSASLWTASRELVKSSDRLTSRARGALQAYIELVRRMTDQLAELPLGEQIKSSIEMSGLGAHFKKDSSEKGQSRIENLQELVGAGKSFEYDAVIEENMTMLDAFLAHAALEAGEGQADAWEDCVQLMTMHSVKGLEFPLVFLVGMEEGLFPHQRSSEEPGRMEEERRLCYVGITRAREQLVVTSAEVRRLFGGESYNMLSRFVREIPDELVQEVRPRAQFTRPGFQATPAVHRERAEQDTGLFVGQRVNHARFGDGVVLNLEGQGPQSRVQVNFEAAGSKWLIANMANLQPA